MTHSRQRPRPASVAAPVEESLSLEPAQEIASVTTTSNAPEVERRLDGLIQRTTVEDLVKTGRVRNLKTVSERDLRELIRQLVTQTIAKHASGLEAADRERVLASVQGELKQTLAAHQDEAARRQALADRVTALERELAEERDRLEVAAETAAELSTRTQDLEAALAAAGRVTVRDPGAETLVQSVLELDAERFAGQHRAAAEGTGRGGDVLRAAALDTIDAASHRIEVLEEALAAATKPSGPDPEVMRRLDASVQQAAAAEAASAAVRATKDALARQLEQAATEMQALRAAKRMDESRIARFEADLAAAAARPALDQALAEAQRRIAIADQARAAAAAERDTAVRRVAALERDLAAAHAPRVRDAASDGSGLFQAGDGSLQVAVAGVDGRLAVGPVDGTPVVLAEGVSPGPALALRLGDAGHVVWRDRSGAVMLSAVGQGAPVSDLCRQTGAPPTASAPVGYSLPGGAGARIAYAGSDGHLHALFCDGGRWRHADLGPVEAAEGADGISAWRWAKEGSEHIGLIDRHGTIHERFLIDGAWHQADPLTTQAGAPAAADALAGCDAGDTEVVLYRGRDGHLQALRYGLTKRWEQEDLTATLGVPAPVGAIHDARHPGGWAAVWRGTDGRVHVLQTAGSSFSTMAIDTPECPVGDPLVGSEGGSVQVVVVADARCHRWTVAPAKG